MKLDNDLLYYFIKDALQTYSEDFSIIDHRNPVQIWLNKKFYSIHISYVHDSGKSRDEEECRIQIGRKRINAQNDFYLKKNLYPVFLGVFKNERVFVAWDPRHVLSVKAKKRVSFYARKRQAQNAIENYSATYGFRSQQLEKTSFAIALQSQALGFYLENIESFHCLQSKEDIASLMKKHSNILGDSGLGRTEEFDFKPGEIKRKFTYNRKYYPRSPRFRFEVMNAYKQACCVCGRQLGLVEAAHIVPHSTPGGLDDVTNGLALCVEHHHLYDDGLLLPGPNQKLVFNCARANYLRETNQDKGLEEVASFKNREYCVPADASQQPSNELLKKGLKLRMAHY